MYRTYVPTKYAHGMFLATTQARAKLRLARRVQMPANTQRIFYFKLFVTKRDATHYMDSL